MSFRSRLTLTSALAVAVAIAIVSVGIYVSLRALLRDQVDRELRQLARRSIVEDSLGTVALTIPPGPLGEPAGYGQLIPASGAVAAVPAGDEAPPVLPQDDRAERVALGLEEPYFDDVRVDGTHVRVYTTQVSEDPPAALQVAQSVEDVDSALRRIGYLLAGVGASGIALAAGLGGIVAKAALVPLTRMTRAAERIAVSGDATKRLHAPGLDEVGRLGAMFNQTLDALNASLRTQSQLVADASHELRTPLTSLKTNLEILRDEGSLMPDERARILASVEDQIDELTALVNDLMELARGNEQVSEDEDVDLQLLVVEVVERARRRYPGTPFAIDAEPSTVRGSPTRIERALTNLIDNAVKWGPQGAPVEIALRGGEVVVRDRGPGIPEEDVPFVFDRFYRSPSARGKPGSGLGLAIVKQVADSHGGSVSVEIPRGGGTAIRLRLLPAP